MTAPRRRYPQSLKDEVVKNIIDTSRPIKDVAAEYGVGAETARVWLHQHRKNTQASDAAQEASQHAASALPAGQETLS